MRATLFFLSLGLKNIKITLEGKKIKLQNENRKYTLAENWNKMLFKKGNVIKWTKIILRFFFPASLYTFGPQIFQKWP